MRFGFRNVHARQTHALRAMRAGKMKRALFMAKGSLFLGRMTEAADGVSFIIEG